MSPHTVDAYRRDLEQLLGFVEERRECEPVLDDLDVLALRGWLGQLARDLKPSSIARKIASARAFFRFLMRVKRTDKNPAGNLSMPKLGRPLPTFLDPETMGEVVEIPRDDLLGLRDRAALETLYGGGLRVSELCGLDVAKVDLDRREVRVIGKGDKERLVPLGRSACETLTTWLSVRPELLRPTSPDDARRGVDDAGARAGAGADVGGPFAAAAATNASTPVASVANATISPIDG